VSYIIFWSIIAGYVLGFGHARFSDYALRNKMWPYNKPDNHERGMLNKDSGPYREPAKVPFMVTRDQQQALADLGYSKDQRSQMKPEEVHTIIEKQTGPKVVRSGPKQFQEDCIDCGTVFTYTFADTFNTFGGRDVKCPSCGKHNIHLA